MGSALSRLERAALQRLAAKQCAAEGRHPPSKTFWQTGDYATPDRLICGRCYAVLAQRRHDARALKG
jgi:hypothetical protein